MLTIKTIKRIIFGKTEKIFFKQLIKDSINADILGISLEDYHRVTRGIPSQRIAQHMNSEAVRVCFNKKWLTFYGHDPATRLKIQRILIRGK